jgi:hypothetical protein
VRARFLEALSQPIEDLKVAADRLEHFHKPVAVVRAIEAKADMAERVLETVSLGLALVELYVRSGEREDGEGES